MDLMTGLPLNKQCVWHVTMCKFFLIPSSQLDHPVVNTLLTNSHSYYYHISHHISVSTVMSMTCSATNIWLCALMCTHWISRIFLIFPLVFLGKKCPFTLLKNAWRYVACNGMWWHTAHAHLFTNTRRRILRDFQLSGWRNILSLAP